MTLRNIAQGEVVTVRIYKQFGGYLWANNYEVAATTNVPDPVVSLQELADRLVTLERNIHLRGVFIDRVTISSYAPDSQPYDPDTLATFPYTLEGVRNYNGEAVPLELCLFVRRSTNFGRDGRLLYRGCLSEGDITAPSFRSVLTSAARNSFQSILDTWQQQGPGSVWVLVMASGTPNPTSIRRVISLQASEKVVVKKFNNRYFRRRP
jgi:hypothetical protein